MTRVATITVGRETFDVGYGSELAAAALDVLDGTEVEVVGSGTDRATPATDPEATAAAVRAALSGNPDVILLVQATFTDASAVIELAESTGTPLVVWSFPEPRTGGNLRLNSLCGANLAAYSLRRRGHRCGFVHIAPDHPEAQARLRTALDDALEATPAVADTARDEPTIGASPAVRQIAAATDTLMRSSRVGVIGDPPVGFEPCLGDDDEIAERFGVIVERLTLDELFDAARTTPEEQVVEVTRRMASTMDLGAMSESDIEPSARLYCAMRRHADEYRFGAFATRCWPECMVDFGGAACTPQAMMGDDGVSGTCEADVLGAVTSVLLRSVSGSAPFVADLVDMDEDDGTSVLWHCGVAPSEMAAPDAPVVGAVHPNRKVPLVNQFVLRPGRVTVCRLSQSGGEYRLVVGGGELLDRPRPFSGTSGVIRWDRPVRDVAATVFGQGLEHHVGIVYGDHQDVLVELAHAWDIPVLRLGIDR